ncbi:MAG: YcjX family protein, partial [Rhizobiales bacterium]|nr:YcjX family protein [Hyphomicrobiales bacterium]
DRLEAILGRMVELAVAKAEFAGATVDVVALAAVRATREALVKQGRDELPSILGTPEKGEMSGGETFDGATEAATFPGDLPTDLDALFSSADGFRGLSATIAEKADYRFLKFRPPAIERATVEEPALPHIRLDRALQFLIGDRLK